MWQPKSSNRLVKSVIFTLPLVVFEETIFAWNQWQIRCCQISGVAFLEHARSQLQNHRESNAVLGLLNQRHSAFPSRWHHSHRNGYVILRLRFFHSPELWFNILATLFVFLLYFRLRLLTHSKHDRVLSSNDTPQVQKMFKQLIKIKTQIQNDIFGCY